MGRCTGRTKSCERQRRNCIPFLNRCLGVKMSSFRTLQSRHEELLNQAQAGQDIIEEVQMFIDDVNASSSQIGASSERDQLRSNLRYWPSYLYEHTQTYPNVD